MESAYWSETAPERSRRLRGTALLGTGLLLPFLLADYLTLGAGWELLVCVAGRASLFLGALAIVLAQERRPDPAALERRVGMLATILPLVLCGLIGLQRREMIVVLPGFTLLTLCYYLFLPLPLATVARGSAVGTAGFLLTGALLLDPTPTVLVLSTLELLLCNGMGLYTALRMQVMGRHQWLNLGALRRHTAVEDLVSRQSTRFITLPLEQIDDGIASALADIGAHAGADRSYIFEVDHERKESSCTHEWCRPGVSGGLIAMQRSPHRDYPWGSRMTLEGRQIVARTLDDLPPEAAPERNAAAALSVRSLLVVPMVAGGQVIGAVGLHTIGHERDWAAEEVTLLRRIGDLIGSAILRKRMEQELRLRNEALEVSVSELERSNSDLQQFAYAASHDLKEPLRVIASFSSLLAQRYRGQLDGKADEYIGFLTSAAARMHRLITDLIEYSRIDQPGRATSACDTRRIVEQALANLGVAVTESRACIEVEALPEVSGDPSQLLQLFQNLVGNALKFRSAAPPMVRIAARRQGAFWEFSVADNGIGIDPRHATHIFRAFTRLHTAEEYPGTGIGLAVCKRIVERHRGRIWVDRNLPHGSVFRFTLAAAD